ncbi:MAG: peptidoglycan/LPS O-acetylase OafA/YrhL [Paraglaciecola sp.]|jgi:peptidoglycan/LPS O-acetylase OafA/YrhL
MHFRTDINGLRAIAVIAVVLYHFNASWLPGGFAGVDVFFVISGFLMTGIIFRGIEQKNFSILRFYIARANRIIPALAVLCFVLLVYGWFYLTPLDYKVLGKHVASSMGFLSNIIYWRESGYFDAASHEKWLLHTWSLSAEWQFYIIYPLVLVAMRKLMSVKAMKATVLIGTVLGFIFCVIITYRWPNSAYYLLPTRAWEMLIGGVAYLYPITLKEERKRLVEWFGVALIVGSYFLISKDNPWPGYLALFPVVGAFLIIQAQCNDSFITSNIISQKIGSWSYSIYLWHWPLVVAIYYYSLNNVFIYLGISLTVLLGFLSNKYIEKIKFRNNFDNLYSYFKCKPIYIVLSVGLMGNFTFVSEGLINRLSDDLQIKYTNATNALGDWGYPRESNLKIGNIDTRFIKGKSDKNILFIGASHIAQTYPYAANFSSEYNIYYVTMGGCFVTPSMVNPKWSCLNIQNYKEIIKNVEFDKIVTSIYCFDCYLSKNNKIKNNQVVERLREYDDFLRFAKDNSKEVFIILGEPKGEAFDPLLSIRHNLKQFITVKEARNQYLTHYDALGELNEANGVVIIDPIDYLCDEVCMVMSNDFNYYYQDANHMRPWYAKKHLQYLDVILE